VHKGEERAAEAVEPDVVAKEESSGPGHRAWRAPGHRVTRVSPAATNGRAGRLSRSFKGPVRQA